MMMMMKIINLGLQKAAVSTILLGFLAAETQAQLLLPAAGPVQPSSVTVQNGGTAVLWNTNVSLTAMSITWLRNGQPVSPVNTSVVNTSGGSGTISTLTISNIIPANAGAYSVQVQNLAGTVTSSNAILAVVGGITLDRSSFANATNRASLTWSHTVGAGTNGILMVNVSTGNGHSVNTMTYGGVALTRMGYVMNSGGSHVSTEMWYLKSPAPGTNSIIVTLSGNDTFTAGATSLFGVNQTLSFGLFTTATGNGNLSGVTVASAPGQIVLDSLAVQSATACTNGSGQTLLWSQSNASVWGSSSFKAGTTNVSLSWTFGARQWAAGAVALYPASTVLPIIGGGISVDNVSSAHTGSSSTSLTWSHVVGAGSNSFLVVSVSTQSGVSVSSITYGGAALFRSGYAINSGGSPVSTEMWYLKSPVAGAANISVILSSKEVFAAGATSFFGVNQALPFGTITNAIGTANAPSVAVAANSSEAVVDVVAAQSATSGALGTGQALLWSQLTGVGGNDVWGSSSVKAGGTNVNMSWNLSSSGGQWAMVAAAINPASSPMALLGVISIDNTSSANSDSSGTTSLAWPHTTGVGFNGVLVVNISTQSGSAVSSITYAGSELTKIGSMSGSSVPHPSTEMWYLKSPASGTANIVVTLNSKDVCAAGAATLFGVNQTVPLGNFATNTGTAFTPNVTVPATLGKVVIDSVVASQSTSGTIGTGQTLLWEQFTGSGSGDIWESSSVKPGTTTNTMSWTLSGTGSGGWAAGAVAFNPAPTGAVYYTAAQMTTNGFTCQLSGPTPATYTLLASTNLVTWTPVATNAVLSGTIQFTNPVATNYASRFYWVEMQ